jgi:arginine decarboxylase
MLRIDVTTGTGHGPTPLAAFDAALLDAGVANYNLIPLSSVIPEASAIRRTKYVTPDDEYGHRLYIVMARQHTVTANAAAWAGLGWTQERGTGRGLFVEIEGADRRQVENDIDATLGAMITGRSIPYGEIETEIVGVECRGEPACALALAVYRSEPWERGARRAGTRATVVPHRLKAPAPFLEPERRSS